VSALQQAAGRVSQNKILVGAVLLVVAFGLGLMPSPYSLLAIGALCSVLWALVCRYTSRVALFVIGAATPALYLLASQPEIWGRLLFGIYGLVGIFCLVHLRVRYTQMKWDRRLVFFTLMWGSYIWFARNLGRFDSGGWDLSYFAASLASLVPFAWLLLVGPFIARSNGQEAVWAGMVTGAAAVAIQFVVYSKLWAFGLADIQVWTRTALFLGQYKNSLGLMWAVGCAILLAWRTRHRILRYAGLGLFLVAIAFSFSRSAYLATLAVILIYVWPHLRRRWPYVLALVGLGVFLLPEAVKDRILLTWSAEGGLDVSSAARLVLWQAALSALLHSPVGGIGLENWDRFLRESGYLMRIGGDQILTYNYTYVHNYFLSLFALTGLMGGILGLAVFVQGYWRSWRMSRQGMVDGMAAHGCILAFFIASLFGEPLFDSILLVVFVLILTQISFKGATTT
jgi:O-antigen ligase